MYAQSILWKIFSEYVLCEDKLGLRAAHRSLALSTSREQREDRMETKMMTNETLWQLLRDFEITPDICSKGALEQSVNYVKFVLGSSDSPNSPSSKRQSDILNSTWSTVDSEDLGNSLRSTNGENGFGGTGGSDSSKKSSRNGMTGESFDIEVERLSFSEFLKVLWQLSIICMEKLPSAHPVVHLQKLFRLMDRYLL